jgi:hypothetical protein
MYDIIWYHVWYHSLAFLALLWYCPKSMTSDMISYLCYDIIYDFTISLVFRLSCAIVLWYCVQYHIQIIWNLQWYQNLMIWLLTSEHTSHDKALWYQYILISLPCDITDSSFMIASPISWNLRGGMARVGAARSQVLHLLRPQHSQRAGYGCLAQRFHVWICCSTHSHYNFKFQVQGGIFKVGHYFKFELMNCCLSLARIQSCSPSWPLSSFRLAALSSELAY